MANPHIISLSQPLTPSMPHWPGDPPTSITAVASHATHGYALRAITIGEHSGTHMNAAISFDPQGATIDTYAPLMAPLIVIDVEAHVAAQGPRTIIDVDMLRRHEDVHGRLPPQAFVAIRTGHARYWNNHHHYLFGVDAPSSSAEQEAQHAPQLAFPGLSVDAAMFLQRDRCIVGIGIDTHGIDPGHDDAFAANNAMAAARIPVVENLAHLERVPPHGAQIVVAPIPIVGGTGAPCTVTAIVPPELVP